MRIFEHSKFTNEQVCPVCGTAKDKAVALIKIVESFDPDLDCEAIQVHIDCLDLGIAKIDKGKVIFQVIGETNELRQ